jgi:TonB family protein
VPPEIDSGQTEPAITQPELIRFAPPRYPHIARQARREASVTLRVRVDVSGRVTEAEPVGEPVGFGFEHEARRAALTALYRPGMIDGVATEMETTLTIRFRLDQE